MTHLFFANRRLLVLAIGLILVSGLSSYYVLPRMEDPLITERAATVTTILPGADAARVESLVTEKLEEELREIDEIKELRSTSAAGVSTLSIELRDEVTAVDEVWSRVRGRIDDAKVKMPPDALDPEFEQITMKAYALIVGVNWRQPGPPNFAILRRTAERLEDALRGVAGTEDVDLFGDPDEEITAVVRPAELAKLGLTITDVAQQLRASDAKMSAGQLRGRGDLVVEVGGELDSMERIARTPIRYGSQGRFTQLADIATLEKGITEPASSLAIVDGEPAVMVGVLMRSNLRIDHWTHAARGVLDEFEQQLPRGVGLSTVFEQNHYVAERLDGLFWNLVLGALAVVAVIFFMMGWRSALVVGAALPLSALMVLSGLRLLGIPIHQMSVTGLIIALGLLIDNAIVMVDEVREKLRVGQTPRSAVSSSVRHLAVPLFGSTLTTALAFAPLALMPGPAGEFVGSIAVSVILAIFSSLLLALTVIPALTAIAGVAGGAAGRWWSGGFSNSRLTEWYSRSLLSLFRRPAWGIVLGLVLPVAGFAVARNLPEQFFPPADRDQFQVELELPASASLAETLRTVRQVREQLLEHDQVERVDWLLGESAPSFYYNLIAKRKNTSNYAQALVQLKSAQGVEALIHRLQRQLDMEVPAARALVRQLEQGPPFDAPIEVRLFGPDLDRLRDLGEEVRSTLVAMPDVLHTRSQLAEAAPKISLTVDEEAARLADLDHESISRQLNTLLEGAVGGSVLEGTEELAVRVRLANTERASLDRIASLDLVSPRPAGQPPVTTPLGALAQVELVPESAAIQRLNGRRMNEVQTFIPAGVLPAKVLADFEQRLATSGFRIPPGYSLAFGGEAAKRDDAIGNLMANVGVLMVLMVATLVLSFSSFRVAALVGSVAVLSVGLGLGSLWLWGFPFGFMAIVGTMGLVGVAINDTIVVLAEIRADQRARAGDIEAVRDVVVRSTRHIIATSLTTMAGFAPLIFGGGGFWPPLGVAIAGGVGGATILSLYYVPSAYLLVMCPVGCGSRVLETTKELEGHSTNEVGSGEWRVAATGS
jgi:multidrug efflux pump subunit AcrB